MTNSIPKPGDRVRLLAMSDDPCPVRAGQVGTVTGVWQHGTGDDAWHQIAVTWDDGRTLMIVAPPDEFEIIGGGK